MTDFRVLSPTPITAAMITSSSIAEPAADETEWVSGAAVTLGDLRIRTTTHRKYECLITHTGRTALPEDDPTYWLDVAPTNMMAPFDTAISTACSIVTPCTYVIRPGFFNAIRFYGLNGAALSVTIKDAPAGTTIFSPGTEDLTAPPLDWYDWAFGVIKQKTKIGYSDIVPYPDAEVTITITAAAGVVVGAGMIAIGDFRDFLDGADWGGTEQGASAEAVNFGDISVNKYGDLKITVGRVGTDMRFKVVMPGTSADYFLESVQDVLFTPVAVVATQSPGFAGLDTFGLITGPMSYDSKGHATFNGYVKGIV